MDRFYDEGTGAIVVTIGIFVAAIERFIIDPFEKGVMQSAWDFCTTMRLGPLFCNSDCPSRAANKTKGQRLDYPDAYSDWLSEPR
jgi:hypothetical protein